MQAYSSIHMWTGQRQGELSSFVHRTRAVASPKTRRKQSCSMLCSLVTGLRTWELSITCHSMEMNECLHHHPRPTTPSRLLRPKSKPEERLRNEIRRDSGSTVRS